MFGTNDFKDYRNALGFGSQAKFREFLSAKDIVANIDFNYIELLNSRLCEIFGRLNSVYYKPCDIEVFLQDTLLARILCLKIIKSLINSTIKADEKRKCILAGFVGI